MAKRKYFGFSECKSKEEVMTKTEVEDLFSTMENKIKEQNVFSISKEVDTGETWIDGKKVYKRTIELAESVDLTTFQMSHGISNVDKIWFDISNSFLWESTYLVSMPMCANTNSSGTELEITFFANRSSLSSKSKASLTQYKKYIVVKYTKTV